MLCRAPMRQPQQAAHQINIRRAEVVVISLYSVEQTFTPHGFAKHLEMRMIGDLSP